MPKIRWTIINDEKMISDNTFVTYKIIKTAFNKQFLVKWGLETLGIYDTQLEAIKACEKNEEAF